MLLNSPQIDQLLETIDRLGDPSSKRYGQLLNWQNPGDPFWHYGIGLSDVYIFDTGRGLQVFERSAAEHVVGIENIAFEGDRTIARLKHAIRVFNTWEYNLAGWNCEHLGRLIATDQPRCYQSKPIWMLCNLTPDGDHKSAHQIFREYLLNIDPSLAG